MYIGASCREASLWLFPESALATGAGQEMPAGAIVGDATGGAGLRACTVHRHRLISGNEGAIPGVEDLFGGFGVLPQKWVTLNRPLGSAGRWLGPERPNKLVIGLDSMVTLGHGGSGPGKPTWHKAPIPAKASNFSQFKPICLKHT
jgi:hypothetical protein